LGWGCSVFQDFPDLGASSFLGFFLSVEVSDLPTAFAGRKNESFCFAFFLSPRARVAGQSPKGSKAVKKLKA
jgi:hypothetical protein